ncbi:MAG TPA: hypothetical protein VHJ38_05465 [Nitrososphaeraceae archaeon]|nr:hypothetical protein [Nitrososphaeraceae archaeon]
MKCEQIFYKLEVIFFSCIILAFIGLLDNVYAFFHDQDVQNTKFIEDSKKIIESLFNQVNNASANYQNDLDKLNLSINDNNNNLTIINKNQEYIDNLKEIISSAKNATVIQEYKSLLNNYIVSVESEMESYSWYNKYLLTGNLTENNLSMDLLSKAYNYETQAINEYKKMESQ